jgi:hypothetical protein
MDSKQAVLDGDFAASFINTKFNKVYVLTFCSFSVHLSVLKCKHLARFAQCSCLYLNCLGSHTHPAFDTRLQTLQQA